MGVSSLDGTRKLKLKRTQTEEAEIFCLKGRHLILAAAASCVDS